MFAVAPGYLGTLDWSEEAGVPVVAHQLGAGDLAAANRLSKIDELLVNACRRYREARLVITLYGQKTSLVLSSSCSSSSSATVCLVSSWVEPQRGQESSAPPIWIPCIM